jgi:hypothetical protein
LRIVDGDVEQREKRWERGLEAPVERQELARELLADSPAVVAAIDPRVGLE